MSEDNIKDKEYEKLIKQVKKNNLELNRLHKERQRRDETIMVMFFMVCMYLIGFVYAYIIFGL